jgi:hypothetical protein
MNKQVGNFEIKTYQDSETVTVVYHHNASFAEQVTFRGANDLWDLQYAISCALRERSERSASRTT